MALGIAMFSLAANGAQIVGTLMLDWELRPPDIVTCGVPFVCIVSVNLNPNMPSEKEWAYTSVSPFFRWVLRPYGALESYYTDWTG